MHDRAFAVAWCTQSLQFGSGLRAACNRRFCRCQSRLRRHGWNRAARGTIVGRATLRTWQRSFQEAMLAVAANTPACLRVALARRWRYRLRTRAAQPSCGSSLPIVITLRWLDAGTKPPDRGTMAHDKIKAAARRRMAKTGESYTAARRQVITEFQVTGGNEPAGEPERFAISYDDMGPISTWADTLLGGGPAGGRIEVDAGELRLRMADFKVDVPRASVRRVARSSHRRGERSACMPGAAAGWRTARLTAWWRSRSTRPATPSAASARCSAG